MAVVATVMVATGVTGAMSGGVPGQGGKPTAGASARSAGGSDAKKDTPGEWARVTGVSGTSNPGRARPEDHRAQYKALFTRALGVLAEDFEQISEADQYSGRIEARQPLTNRVAAIEIRRSDDGRLAVGVRVSQEAAGQKHREAGLERAILQRLNAQAEEQPEKPRTASTAAKTAANGQALPDRDALQGLWVLDKWDLGKTLRGDEERQAKELIGKMQFLVNGDIWWGMMAGEGTGVMPSHAKLDPSKNPKWIDITDRAGGGESRCIYELDGDKLRICMGAGNGEARPAEFNTEDDTPLMVMHFRREKLPPAAGEKALVGSWENPFERIGVEEGKNVRTPIQRVEILDGYLFAFIKDDNGGSWFGGKYTLDATKNPQWIDLDLVGPMPGNEKVAKLYGCYEVADGHLKLAFGTTGKRAVRPLELKADKDVLFFDVKATKEPLRPVEKVIRDAVPAPKPKDLAKSPPQPPPTLRAPDSLPAPRSKVEKQPAAETPGVEDDRVDALMKEGKFGEAEDLLRVMLAQANGLRAAEYRLQLGICLTERGKRGDPKDARTPWSQAAGNFSLALKELADEKQPDAARAARLRTQVGLRTLQLHQLAGKPNDLLLAATVFLQQHRGTVEELIGLSLVYHALKQKNESGRALQTRDRMLELFEKLKDEPGAFTAKEGEYSRDYWEKTWFADERAKRP